MVDASTGTRIASAAHAACTCSICYSIRQLHDVYARTTKLRALQRAATAVLAAAAAADCRLTQYGSPAALPWRVVTMFPRKYS